MDSFEYTGRWWLPSDPNTEVSGTVSYSGEDGILLDLVGTLDELGAKEWHPLVLGLMRDEARFVTLVGCRRARLHVAFPGFTSERFRAATVYVSRYGPHFTHVDELRFRKVEVQYDHLPEWAGITGFQEHSYEDEHGRQRYRFEFVRPEPVVATTESGIVSVGFGFGYRGSVLREVSLSQSVSILIEVPEPLSFEDLYLRFIQPFRNLLTLATGKPNWTTNVEVRVENGSSSRPSQVFFRTGHCQPTAKKGLPLSDMLFSLSDIGADFEVVVARWLSVAQDLDSVSNLFFGVQYSPEMYLEHQFLNLVQAAEVYHRRRVGNEALKRDEYKRRRKLVLESAPSGCKQWLKGQLSNEPHLEQRIKELTDETGAVLLPLVREAGQFAKRVARTRNYLTHYNPQLRSRAVQDARLYELTRSLSFLIQACFLRELGLSAEQSASFFQRNSGYRFALTQAQALD